MDLDAKAEALAQLMEDRLGLRGDGFAAKLKRAGRRLPRRIRRDGGAVIVEALALQAHPKLSRRVDEAQLARAVTHLDRFLRSIDPWERRKGAMLNWLAGLAFSLLVVAGLVVVVLRWRGLV